MAERAKSTRNIRRLMFLFLVTGILFTMPMQSLAKSNKAKLAIKAYKTFLEQEKIYVVPRRTWFEEYTTRLNYCWQGKVSFSLAYIDNDSVPELFLKGSARNGTCKCVALFGYKNGSVVRIGFEQEESGDPWKSIKGYYKKNGVIRLFSGEDTGEYVVKYKSGRLNDYGYHYKKIYNWKEKKISKSKYNRKFRKLSGGKKMTKVKWYADTEKNREKYLK